MFEGLIGAEMPLVIRLCLAFLIVLGFVSAAAWALSRSGRGRSAGANGRQLRLAIIDSAGFEGSRRLILIRRDSVEHLLMIGGPTDVVVEANILHAAGGPLELPVTRSPAAAERQPRAIPQADKGSKPLPPEQTAIPHPALQLRSPVPPPFRPLSEEQVAGFQAKAEPPTQLKRDTQAALANELSTRAPAPSKGLATAARPHPVEPHPELRFEPSVKLRSKPGTEPRSESDPGHRPECVVETQAEPPMEAPQSAQPVAVETAPTADEELAELARLLEAKLRKPNVPANANPSSVPASIAAPQERAWAAAAPPSPPPPVRAWPPSEPKLPRADAEITTPSDSLEQQLASLLGRAIRN